MLEKTQLQLFTPRIWLSLDPSYRVALWSILVLNVLAFGSFLSNPVFAPDDWAHLASSGWISQQGFPSDRPVADLLFPFLFSGAMAPFSQIAIFIAANVLSTLLLSQHWGLQHARDIILVGALISVCPAWADQYSFVTNTVRFMPLTFPLAIIAYLLAIQSSIVARIGAFVLISVTIGLYQLGINSYVMLGVVVSQIIPPPISRVISEQIQLEVPH
jgi:hypothetical protein